MIQVLKKKCDCNFDTKNTKKKEFKSMKKIINQIDKNDNNLKFKKIKL